MSNPSVEPSSGGLARTCSLNQGRKVELCSLITSAFVLHSPRSWYFFAMVSLCSVAKGSTTSRCCSTTKFALSKSLRRPEWSTCSSLRTGHVTNESFDYPIHPLERHHVVQECRPEVYDVVHNVDKQMHHDVKER